MGHPSGSRWRVGVAGAVALVLLGGTGALADGSTDGSTAVETVPLIIDGGGDAAKRAVQSVGGVITGEFPVINGVTADVPADRVEQLKGLLPTIHITPDEPVVPPEAPAPAPVQEAQPASAPSTSLADVAALTGADRLQSAGVTGAGVDVAVIDTGISPVPGLDDPRRVVNGPDLSFDSQLDATRYLDTYGHGTNMASIIGANGPAKGIAPGSRLVNVKVGGANGAVDVSQIIAAIDWVVQNRKSNGLNIRVLNLSLGTDGKQRAALDPLVHAADVAWRNGIVVVAAVGNDGDADGSVANPASNPNILAVGAVDSNGSRNPDDVTMAAFSSTGNGKRTPDLVAPGARVLGLRVPGSNLDVSYPEARRDGAYFRGSGTSQAAAVVSGAAALLLQQRPALTPWQVKALLTDTARDLPESKKISGDGLLDVAAAAAAPVPTKTEPLKRMTGVGSLEEARGSLHVSANGVDLRGEKDVFGRTYNATERASARVNGASWSGGTWNGASWSGASWSGASWSGASWSGASWSGASWSGASWSGASWSGASWSGASWSGASWSGASWSGASWSGASWSGASWSGASWSGASWSGASWSGGTWFGNAWA